MKITRMTLSPCSATATTAFPLASATFASAQPQSRSEILQAYPAFARCIILADGPPKECLALPDIGEI